MTAGILFAWMLFAVVALFLLRLAADLLNLRALGQPLPEEFRGHVDEEEYKRSQRYTRVRSRAGIIESSVSLLLFLGFWIGGGFAWLHGWSESWGFGPLLTGLAVFALIGLAHWAISLPFDLYYTFVIEERFGFNRTTPGTYVVDQIKSLLLTVVLGGALAALVLWILLSLPMAWLWAWIGVTLFSLVVTFIAPSWLLPLFNRFEPLADGELKRTVEALAERCGFPLSGVYVIDGSKRSTKANAYFTGFGRNRRIALYDTLIERHSTGELETVLAHEIGHFKKRHVAKQIAIGILSMGLMFFLLGLLLPAPALYGAFGIEINDAPPPLHFGLIFFFVFYMPLSRLLGIVSCWRSRVNEFEADAYAAEVTGRPQDLASALLRLSVDSASNLTPHPLLVWLEYTHPPTAKRLAALRAMQA